MESKRFRKNGKSAIKLFYLFSSLIATSIIVYLALENHLDNLLPLFKSREKIHYNYFLEAWRLDEMGFIVNTSTCKIPDFNPWESSIIPFIHKSVPLEDCIKTNYNWSSVIGNSLIIHNENMDEDGYSFETNFCCYKKIERVEQPEDNFDKSADNLISYSSCIPILKEETEISSEFIMVECSWPKMVKVIYRGFHGSALASADNDLTLPRIKRKRKTDYWKTQKVPLLPPNILIIGQDSTSRINFRRNMLKTLRVLKSIGAIEMLGYTKVGENTFPNFCPIFTGYSEEDLKNICIPLNSKLDDCPWIWNRFDEANYLTGHTEDSPDFTGFNFWKVGFVKQPVDFYVRPLWLAASDYGYSVPLYRADHIDCVSYLTNDEMIASYMESTMDFAKRNKTPIFTFSWSTTLSHDNLNNIQLSDETYAQFLEKMLNKGYLENTILIFMGDHGYRYGASRETLIGYFEDKLPNMWIRLPKKVKEKFPEWQKALEINSKRLTSPYTLYWTLNLIMESYTQIKKPNEDAILLNSENKITRKYRYNFFEDIPANLSCRDLGVPEVYCACYLLQKIDLKDELLEAAANKATQWVNSEILGGSQCASLNVIKITSGAKMEKTLIEDNKDTKKKVMRYIVGYLVSPGGFLIEAEIDYFQSNETFSNLPNVQRASKINQDDIKCAKDSKLELFCYCST